MAGDALGHRGEDGEQGGGRGRRGEEVKGERTETETPQTEAKPLPCGSLFALLGHAVPFHPSGSHANANTCARVRRRTCEPSTRIDASARKLRCV